MIALLGCLMAHVALSMMITSPWWVPDLTLVGLLLAIFALPSAWVPCAGVAGLATMVWAVRFPVPIAMSYVLIGMVAQRLTRQWDTTDVRVQCLVVGAAGTLMTAGLLWLETLVSLRLVGLVFVHGLMTGLSVLIVRRCFMWHALRFTRAGITSLLWRPVR